MLKHSVFTKNLEAAKNYFSDKLAFTLGPAELKEEMSSPEIKIIDVRSHEAYNKSHIPGAISIPFDDLKFQIGSLSKDKINVVYCYNQQCHLGARAALYLVKSGYPVMELEGGFRSWRDDFEYDVVS